MNNAVRSLWIDGIALWAPALPGWAVAAPALRSACAVSEASDANAALSAAGTEATEATAGRRPRPGMLAPNERRRAPDAVLLALEVASAAVAASGHAAASLASVFTSAHGDLATTDALCRQLATEPLLLSPTRFHHSVHNSGSGYWAIGSGSAAASTALSAFEHSFAAGWFEAACQCAADGEPRLLVGADTEAVGALASVNRSRGLLAVALVLAPAASARSVWAIDWQRVAAPAIAPPLRSAAAMALAVNAMADALPLFEVLAEGRAAGLVLPLSATSHLVLALRPLRPPGALS